MIVMASRFEIYKDKAEEYRFRLRAANNEVIAMSEAYTTKKGCIKGVESVKENAPIAELEDQTVFNNKNAMKVLKLLGRFQTLEGPELRELTNFNPELLNDIIDYLNNLGAVKIKGKTPPLTFSKISITKDGQKLYNKKLLEGKFDL